MTLPVTRVVVHPDGAVVTRSGKADLAGGTVWIRRLPLMLDVSSVRATLPGRTVVSVRVELDLLDEDRGEAPRLAGAVLRARDALATLDARIAGIADVRSALAGLAIAAEVNDRRDVPDPSRFAAWAEVEEDLGERLAALDDQLRELKVARRRDSEQLAVLEHQLASASSASVWERWLPTRRVAITAGGPVPDGEVEAEVSYRIGAASWTPSYTLDADDALRKGRLAMRATIVQASGEDWRDVALTLTSAPAERKVDVPELDALRLGARQPRMPTGWRALPADLDGLFPAGLPTAATPPAMPVNAPRQAPAPSPPLPVPEPAPEQDTDLSLAYDEVPVTRAPARRPAPSRPSAPEPQMFALSGAPRGKSRSAAGALLAPVAAAAAVAGAIVEAASGGGAKRDTGRMEPQEPEGIDIGGDWLAYDELELGGWDQVAGVRGRLRSVHEDARLHRVSAEGAARLRAQRESALRSAAAARNPPLPPHHVLPAPLDGVDVAFDAAGKVDLPSDGAPHTVAVATWEAELDVAYRTVPRADPRAFRRVSARISRDGALLPGPVDVYVGGRLELTSPWTGSAGRGRLLIGLGAEDRLKIARNVRYREETAGVFGGSRRLHTSIEVTVASSLPTAVSLEVIERVPVPIDAREVEVSLTSSSPVAEVFTGEPGDPILKGGRSQTVSVSPGGEARASLAYAVTLGGKDEIVGGDRRG